MGEETSFLYTLIQALQADNLDEIARLLKPAKLHFDYTSIFTKKSYQCKCFIEIKIPVSAKKSLEKHKHILADYCAQIFEETDEYAFEDVKFGILKDAADNFKEETGTLQPYTRNQIYTNLLAKLSTTEIDKVEADYLHEACNCAINGLRLSAITMLGCAAECLLIQLCKAYLDYLKNGNGTEQEINKFEKEVIQAKKASARLNEFQIKVKNKHSLFESMGLENANLQFSYLDLLRQVRNDSGHPTGYVVSYEDMNTYFANYQLLIERVHPVIKKLPKIMP
ncbi:MAG: hypothetical protein JEZ00_11370 [Anaerolineaceae bacterium]|nr:hypothetical protein [Anaerolineaceae bacterium]